MSKREREKVCALERLRLSERERESECKNDKETERGCWYDDGSIKSREI